MSSLHFKQGYQIAYAAERAAVEKNSEKANESVGRLIIYLKELLGYLKRDGLVWEGAVRGARYNPPWTVPFMNHNEVQVALKKLVE